MVVIILYIIADWVLIDGHKFFVVVRSADMFIWRVQLLHAWGRSGRTKALVCVFVCVCVCETPWRANSYCHYIHPFRLSACSVGDTHHLSLTPTGVHCNTSSPPPPPDRCTTRVWLDYRSLLTPEPPGHLWGGHTCCNRGNQRQHAHACGVKCKDTFIRDVLLVEL